MSRPIRVVLVEDNPGDADLTRETLQSGKLLMDIQVVTDGAMAVDYLLERVAAGLATPDLVLLDLNLPKLSGREVLATIKGHEKLRTIPVVILTSSDAEQDIVRSYDMGANCYVTKPVGLEAFQAIVRSLQQFWFKVVKLP